MTFFYHLKQANNAPAFAKLRILCAESTPHTHDMNQLIASVIYQAWVKLEYCVGQAPQDFVYAWNLLANEADEYSNLSYQAKSEQFIVAISAHPCSIYWLGYLGYDPTLIWDETDDCLRASVEFEQNRISHEGKVLGGRRLKGIKGNGTA